MNCPNCGKKMVRSGFMIMSDRTSRDILFCRDGCWHTMVVPVGSSTRMIDLANIKDITGQGLYAGRSAPPIERCDIKPEWDEAVRRLVEG